jgi:tetratricopeptide (TPR) repeat protein
MRRFSAYLLIGLNVLLMASVVHPELAHSESAHTIGTDPHLSDGARALQMGNYDEGIRLTLEGLKRHPLHRHRASALNNLCAGYVGNQEFEEAIRRCSDAIEIDGRNWRMYNNRALAYLGMGRIGAAQRDAKKGLALNPDGPTLTKVEAMIREQGSHLLLAGAD